MDPSRIDNLTRSVDAALSRRGLGKLAGAGALLATVASLGTGPEIAAKRRVRGEHNRRKGGKKTILCHDGETIRVATKHRKKWLKRGATRGKCDNACTPVCPPGSCLIDNGCGGTCPDCGKGFTCENGVCEVCTPVCPPGTCGGDGCGGTCNCDAGTICVEGMCVACTVTCTGTPVECGGDLIIALNAGGDIYLCPGIYRGAFAPDTDANIYGAGNGDDDTVDTIISGVAANSTFLIEGLTPLTLLFSNLRITDGGSTLYGGNFYFSHADASVTVENCVVTNGAAEYGAAFYIDNNGTLAIQNSTVTNNTSANGYGPGLYMAGNANVTITDSLFSGNSCAFDGGAIYVDDGTVTITGCTITDNTAATYGGGLANGGGIVSVSNTSFTENTADKGGGIYCESGTVDLDATVSITSNTATDATPSGGGVFVFGGTFNRNGATISGNTPDQCVGTGC